MCYTDYVGRLPFGSRPFAWWARLDSNQRCFYVTNLQSAAVAAMHTDPYWWNRLGLNQRRPDFQSGALPTELRFHISNWSKSTSLVFGVNDGNRTRDRRNHNPLPYRLATSTMIGADRGARTPDPRLKRALLYQLSYVRIFGGARRTRI